MFKNMKIKTSLLVGFGISIGVSIIIIIAAVITMNSMRAQFNAISEAEIEGNDVVLELRLDTNIAARIIRDMALLPNGASFDDQKARTEEMLDELGVKIQELEKIGLFEDEVKVYSTQINNWREAVPGVLDMLSSGDVENAKYIIETKSSPALDEMIETAKDLDQKFTDAKNQKLEDMNRHMIFVTVMLCVVLIVALIAIFIIVRKIIKNITEPTEQVHKALAGFSEGNFNIPVEFESANELGDMCNALRKSQGILGGVIQDICELLGQMAEGNFNVRSRDRSLYVGALESVIQSMANIKLKLNSVLTQIHQSAEQVTSSSEQVSSGAQALSQGATQQAASVQELAATIAEISDQVNRNAENTKLGSDKAKSVGADILHSNELMQEMTVAMENIKTKSQQISNIIKTIEDIAFQTDILALNAAVEAARAGAAGKGFAVVADEVRNLATKSAEASKDTAVLIEDSVEAVENGSRIATETAQTLLEVVEGTKEIVSTIDQISEASQQQADSVSQVTQGVDQISSVVQTNSATAQESAATSQELSGQANMLKMLVSQFDLEMDSTDSYVPDYGY